MPKVPLSMFAVRSLSPTPSTVLLTTSENRIREIAVQVKLVAVLINALHAALEDREEAFNRVRSHVAATEFLFVVHRLMDDDVLAAVLVDARRAVCRRLSLAAFSRTMAATALTLAVWA